MPALNLQGQILIMNFQEFMPITIWVGVGEFVIQNMTNASLKYGGKLGLYRYPNGLSAVFNVIKQAGLLEDLVEYRAVIIPGDLEVIF